MAVLIRDLRSSRTRPWKWWVCGLLLLATMINYMDRLTLNLLADTIKTDLSFNAAQYGYIEAAFAVAFGVGALVFGWVVDRWNVVWVYPLALLAWSAAGFFSGFAQGFLTLLLCRFLLGLAESANWPCALRTTQRILAPGERTLGNSILQSGAALGAILIPLLLLVLPDPARPQGWRLPFFIVGGCGVAWALVWWASVRAPDLALTTSRPAGEAPLNGAAPESKPALPAGLLVRRFFALVVLVVTINMTWHFLRAWLPLFLRERGYSQADTNWFTSAYYVCAAAGSLAAGFATLALARRGCTVHGSRVLVFVAAALLAVLCLAAPFLPPGPLLLGLLLVVGFGSLGAFPAYYSFSQDLTVRHQGKLTGTLGACCWLALAGWQALIGQVVQSTGSYQACFVVAGLAPLVGFLALVVLWGPTGQPATALPLPAVPGHGLTDHRLQVLPGPEDERIRTSEACIKAAPGLRE